MKSPTYRNKLSEKHCVSAWVGWPRGIFNLAKERNLELSVGVGTWQFKRKALFLTLPKKRSKSRFTFLTILKSCVYLD
jgi:hypothetical protein